MKNKTRYKIVRLLTFFGGLLMVALAVRWLTTITDNVTSTFGLVAVGIGYFLVLIIGVMWMYEGLKMRYKE